MRYANVIVDITHEKLDKTFQYIIPDELKDSVYPGVQAEVPFGRGNRSIKCYVVEVTDTAEYDISKMKEIIRIVPDSIPIESQLIAVAAWIKENYGSTMNRALKTVIPVHRTIKEKRQEYVRLKASISETKSLMEKYHHDKRMSARVRLLEELVSKEEISMELLTKKMGISKNVIKSLKESGIIDIRYDTIYRTPFGNPGAESERNILSDEQRETVSSIVTEMDSPSGIRTHLIFGVTGSGKTEVYMECIEHVLSKGRQVIVLIPEIALTYQNVTRFYKRFGDKVSIINSRMSQGERYDQFRMAKEGKVQIMIGPRSALFTPFSDLGLIIIDEEHEPAYKSETVPKYHARETAIMRAGLTDATVILGSATPSTEAFYKAENGEYMLHRMDNRVKNKPMPKVNVVDLRQELKEGNKSIFSRKLMELIKDRISKSQQVILFVNRRGYAGFVSCRSCGKPLRCPHCDVSLTYHKRVGREIMSCHYCGYQIEKPKLCPVCGSKYMGKFGIGTESVEEKISELFPEAKVLRMDMDTTSGKDGHEKILSSFANHDADILVGTQMIVKGHDFPKVTLVGVIAADLSLYASDYRATERTFQLLTQAAGRAGRGEESGEVVIQTYSPEEYSIVEAANQDYDAFYRKEISYRNLMRYPPVYNMAAILITSDNEKLCCEGAQDIAQRIKKSHIDGLTVIGASEASVSKINDIYRYVIYIKHNDYNALVHIKNGVELYIDKKVIYKKRLTVQFDFTPMDNY
ncbi:MAG: primosomal protein N' [Lachnospiraceae bacterium]|nr:primosomal protein N' [Lachnospiraceae bacterium]MDE6254480.1 primosomal protein N' [Lachnospiraceae bacterium]